MPTCRAFDSGSASAPASRSCCCTPTPAPARSGNRRSPPSRRAGFRAIAFDRRGWGRSTADPATGAQPGHVAEDLDRLADFLSLNRFHLVGVAGGGFVALDYAAWRAERLRSLVVGASTGAVSDKTIQDVIARIEIPGIRALPAHYREVGPSYRAVTEGTARWLEIHEHAQQKGAPSQPLRSPNTFAKLGTIAVRTLVMPAGADLLAPPALMWIWAQHVKDAQWVVVPDAGHAVAWSSLNTSTRTRSSFYAAAPGSRRPRTRRGRSSTSAVRQGSRRSAART